MGYYVHKTYTYDSTPQPHLTKKDFFEFFRPPTFESRHYKNWISRLDIKTCFICRDKHGKIYTITEFPDEKPPIHIHCRCEIQNMKAANIGTATQDGILGADVVVKNTGKLPSHYITKQQARQLGWISFLGNLDQVAPGKSIGGEIYQNRNEHLPQAIGRTWFEADINYDSGIRNSHRLLFSNDGLLFATYDHYKTFVEIK